MSPLPRWVRVNAPFAKRKGARASEATRAGDARDGGLSRRREVLVGSPAAHSSSHVREVRIQNMIDYAFSV